MSSFGFDLLHLVKKCLGCLVPHQQATRNAGRKQRPLLVHTCRSCEIALVHGCVAQRSVCSQQCDCCCAVLHADWLVGVCSFSSCCSLCPPSPSRLLSCCCCRSPRRRFSNYQRSSSNSNTYSHFTARPPAAVFVPDLADPSLLCFLLLLLHYVSTGSLRHHSCHHVRSDPKQRRGP